MAAKKFQCVRCDTSFSPGSWNCADGLPHQVESKTYYIPTEGLQVDYGPVTGDSVMNRRRGVIQFSRGTFTTCDPQQQEFLDTYPGCISAERWQEIHIPEKERMAQQQRKYERLEREHNALLEEIRKKNGKQA